VGATDIGAERQRAVQEFGGNDRNWLRVRDWLRSLSELRNGASISRCKQPKAQRLTPTAIRISEA
jgi:hypothetical protein